MNWLFNLFAKRVAVQMLSAAKDEGIFTVGRGTNSYSVGVLRNFLDDALAASTTQWIDNKDNFTKMVEHASSYVEPHIMRKVEAQEEIRLKKLVDEYIKSEEFIDAIINRIKNKQL